MPDLHYTKAHRKAKLIAELEAATGLRCLGSAALLTGFYFQDAGDAITVVVPNDVPEPTVAAVIAAHDGATASPAEDGVGDLPDLSTLLAQAAATVQRMAQIESAGSPTNAQVIAAVRDQATAIKQIVRVLTYLARRAGG